MAAPTPPVAGALTGAGYTLANGVYSKSFGSIVVTFNIGSEPGTGTMSIATNGDVSATDIANVQASLAGFGYANNFFQNGLYQVVGSGQAGAFPAVNVGGAGGCTYYGQTL